MIQDIQSHPFAQGFWPEHVARLSAMASEVNFHPAEVIFHEGDPSSLFYLLISGNVALEVSSPGRAVRVATLYAGDVLGWSSVTGDAEGKQFRARALEEIHAIAFDGVRLRHACEEDYAFGFWFMRAVLNVVSARLHAIRAQLVDSYTPPGGSEMNIGIVRERDAFDRRVALTPPVVRRLSEAGCTVWVESGAGDGAMFSDTEYQRAGAQVGYTPAEIVGRADLLVKIGRPTAEEVAWCKPGTALMAFYHMAVADRALVDGLSERGITAIGCEVIEQEDGNLPVLAAISEIAGQMTVPIAAHLMRTSSGGRGILLGGSPGVPPARIVVLGVGSAGFAAARTAARSGARVIAFDRDPRKLRRVMEHIPHVDTSLADEDSIGEAVASADVVIGAVLVAGRRTPHVVTRAMVERMKTGAALIDVSIDQGGCFETSHPTSMDQPAFVFEGVTHFCVPNFTADLGRSASIAVAQALLPYVLTMAKHGVTGALAQCSELARGVYAVEGVRA